MSKARLAPILALCLLSAGCVQRVRVESSHPIYARPELSLLEKARALEDAIWTWCVDEDGLLLWRCYPRRDYDSPLGWKAGRHDAPQWQESYNMADMPAWQGQYISALALQWAATGESTEARILHLLGGLERCYEITATPGLLVRSYIRHEGDEPLLWMKTRAVAKEQGERAKGYWKKGAKGYWFRNAVAGGHHQGVFTALCVLGGLDHRGKISLSEEARTRIRRFFAPMYDRIRANGYKIIDHNGRATGFGAMSVHNYNPQYALWHLTLNRAATLWEVSAPNAQEPDPAVEYERIERRYSEVVSRSYRAVAAALVRLDVDHRLLKANDIHWGHHAWLGLLVANTPESSKSMRDIRRGFEGLWRLHDPFNMHNYVIQKAGRPDLHDAEMQAYALYALEWYPLNKFVFEEQVTRDTKKWQPIQNRKISTSYAKGKPYRRARLGEHTGTLRTNQYQCGFDYLLNFWMSEYFGTFQDAT